MKLVAHGFSGNTTLRGTLTAVDEQGNPLGWESNGNWSSPHFRAGASKDLVATTGITEDKARALVARALQEARRQAGIASPGGVEPRPQHGLPIIALGDRQPRDIEADAWRLLQPGGGTGPEFFALGSAVVHLEREKGGVYLHTLTLAGLRRNLGARGDFLYLGDKGERPAVPPKTMLEDMLAIPQPPLPPIEGIAQTPVFTRDWQLLATPGYHPDPGLFLNLEAEIPPVPDSPSPEDVEEAKALLLEELLGDFPFSSQADCAHAVALLLTPILRSAIRGATPLFLIEAPVQGTGKGLLAQAPGLVLAAGASAVMTEARDEDEWRKRITSKLKQAPAIILIDNIRLPLRAAALSAALTEAVWEDRELGASRMVRLPVRCTWLATGNNPAVSGEMARRIVRIRIDAAMERPWERSGFRHEPLEVWVLEHRGELLWALLTLVRAWLAAGRPPGQPRMGRFQQWADTVGGILAVAGIPGFLENRQEVYALAAAETEGWRAFVQIWWDTYGDKRVGVDLLFKMAKESKLLTELRAGRSEHGARVAMGMDLSNLRDRVIGEWVIRTAGSGQGVMHYRLERPSPPSPKTKVRVEKDQQDQPSTAAQPALSLGGTGGSSGSFSTLTATVERSGVQPPPQRDEALDNDWGRSRHGCPGRS